MTTEAMTTDKKQFVFVTGIARSGTTAFAELLNSHSSICLGVERYKFTLLKQKSFAPELFSRARFFDFRETDTNVLPVDSPKWTRLYGAMASRFDQAKVLGDKIPDAIGQLGLVEKAFPQARYFWLVRAPHSVALSWQRRADNPADRWPANRGYRQAALDWRLQHQELLRLLADDSMGGRMHLVDYDKLFSGDIDVLNGVLSHLSLECDDGMARFYRGLTTKYVGTIKPKSISLADENRDEITSLVGADLLQSVLNRL